MIPGAGPALKLRSARFAIDMRPVLLGGSCPQPVVRTIHVSPGVRSPQQIKASCARLSLHIANEKPDPGGNRGRAGTPNRWPRSMGHLLVPRTRGKKAAIRPRSASRTARGASGGRARGALRGGSCTRVARRWPLLARHDPGALAVPPSVGQRRPRGRHLLPLAHRGPVRLRSDRWRSAGHPRRRRPRRRRCGSTAARVTTVCRPALRATPQCTSVPGDAG